jgi:hypothetical protein
VAIKPKYQLKDLFQTGDLISQGSMNDLIDSTYNPSLIAGSNIFITGVDTPSGRQITISSSGGGGGGGTPSGSDTEIQYNNSGVFGSDSGFIRTPKGFFASQAEGGPLQAETIVGSGDFTEVGGDPAFATGSLFFDDETDIFCLAGDLTPLTGEKSIVNYILGPTASSLYLQVQDEVDIITENIAGDEVTSISAATNEAVLKHESPTLTTQIIVDTLGVTFNFNEGSDVYTFPTTAGTAGQVLTTIGVGQVSWITPTVPGKFVIGAEQTANFRAVKGTLHPINTLGGAVAVLPPLGPHSPGDTWAIVDSRSNAAAANITIGFFTDSQLSYGSAANKTMGSDEEMYTYHYINATVGWIRQR